jgi:formiminoglutamate deiminase
VPVSRSFWCERAWLPDGVADGVLVECSGGVITSVSAGVAPAGHRLPGVVFPGFANMHSHAFHRALRGRTHGGGGTFWTWREGMYAVAARLDPDTYHRLARLVYAEMVVAGFTSVAEFHYLHHGPGGVRYADPNAMGAALIAAAEDAGIRLTLLDTLYLAGGLDATGPVPLAGPQVRFGDGDLEGWADRVNRLPGIGAAVHSVRAVPAAVLPGFASLTLDRPVHVHLSEQPAENEACVARYGCSPTELLADAGLLRSSTTAVHATHLSERDIHLLGSAGVTACFCPTTEADLADGIGPARELADAGCPIALGSDQHAVIDPLIEARALEHGERLRTGRRGRFTPAQLVAAATNRQALVVGAPCDLVAVRTDTVRTAGSSADQLVLAGSASDVDVVVVGGAVVARGGEHVRLGTVGTQLAAVIEELWV